MSAYLQTWSNQSINQTNDMHEWYASNDMHEFCTIVRAQYLQKNFLRIFLYLLQNLCWKPRIRGVILRRFLRLRGSFSGRRPPKIKKTRLETANRIPTFLIPGTWINSFMWINSFINTGHVLYWCSCIMFVHEARRRFIIILIYIYIHNIYL